MSKASRTETGVEELLIDVDLPAATYVFAASIVLDNQTLTSTLIRGESQPAILRLSYVTRWSNKRHPNREFIYELEVPPDTWLVHGSRVARFEAEEGKEVVQSIRLVPLRLGICTLPKVHIRVATPDDDVILHTELKSQYQTVTVVDGTKGVTVAVGAGEQLGATTEVVHAVTG